MRRVDCLAQILSKKEIKKICKIFYKKTSFLQPISFVIIPILIGIFLLVNIKLAQAAAVVPTYNVFGVVTDSATSESLANVTVHINTSMGSFSVQTNELGLYQQLFIDCDNYFNSVTIDVSYEGYQDYSQVISVPCYSTYQHNIALELKSAVPEPVILLPGIMASWNRNLLDENLEYADQWVLDPHFHTYDGLVSDLQTYGGYVLDETLFPFPYDWRQSNEFTAQLLYGKIQAIKQQTGAEKVDIVAHSMGGLVVRQYIQSDLYQNDVDQLIFIATPQRGAPKAYLAWEGGYLGTTIVSDFVKELLVAKIAKIDGFCDSLFDRNRCVYEYVHGYPVESVRELLPDYDYLRSSVTAEIFPYPYGYPQNQFLENLNSSTNLEKLYNSDIEISTIYNATPDSTVGEINIIDRTSTQEPFWEHGYPDGFSSLDRLSGIILNSGDTTVPYSSAIFINSDNQVAKLNTNHRKIVDVAAQNVIEILKNEFININVIDQPDEYIIIQVHSPVDMLLTLPSGQKVGSSAESDVNEIEGAYYSGGNAQNEYIVLPKKEIGDYNLFLLGTGIGEYQVDVSLVTDENIKIESWQGLIAPDVALDVNIQVTTSEILPIVPVDQEKPVINIILPVNGIYEHNQILPIEFTATDALSGIATASLYIDDKIYSNNDIDLFTFSLGEHLLKLVAIDWAGNLQEKQVEFEIIASFDSLRADINRLFIQADIIDMKTKNLLLKEVDWLERSDEKLEQFVDKGHLSGILPPWLCQKLAEQIIDKILFKLYNSQMISQFAYDILKEQFIYIINN